MSNPEVFVDGLLNVTLVKGLVRLDFFTLSATETQKDGQPAPELRQRLIMNPQSLVEVFQSLQVAIMALNEKGVVNVRPIVNDPAPPPLMVAPPALPGAGPTAPGDPAAAPIDTPPPPRSRNFPTTMGN